MTLCMAFPIKLSTGFIVDLRYIPFLLVALYGGYKYSFPLYITLNVVRFFIGGAGIINSLIFSTFMFIFVPLLNKLFIKQNSKQRILIAVTASILTAVLYLTSLLFFISALNKEFWTLTFYTLSTLVIGTVILMILIEKIIANMKRRESLLHAERLNVISELSASVSHEIRNPLTVTSGFLQLLNQSKTMAKEDKKYIEFSLLELKRAEQIVSDFLAFAKPQSENMIYSNLKDETEYVKNIITPYANMYQVDIQYSFTNTLSFRYDKNQIQQCLINLYKNAVEAMKDQGGILSIDISEHKKNIVIKIKDSGIGMTKEEILRLGRPYYSTKKEGTGLGMLMVYSTINKVNGKIDVESEKGKGTTFLLTIPV